MCAEETRAAGDECGGALPLLNRGATLRAGCDRRHPCCSFTWSLTRHGFASKLDLNVVGGQYHHAVAGGFACASSTHPLPRGGTDLIGPQVARSEWWY